MTDTLIRIPPDSVSGKAVYMIGVQRTVQGTPILVHVPTNVQADMPVYVATVQNSQVSGGKNHFSFVNLSGSNKTVRINSIYAYPNFSGLINGANISMEIHGVLGTNPSGGSVVNIRNHDTDDGSLPSQIECRSGPSATPASNWVLAGGTINTEETSSRESQSKLFSKYDTGSALILRNNEGILGKQTSFSGAGNINFHIHFQVD